LDIIIEMEKCTFNSGSGGMERDDDVADPKNKQKCVNDNDESNKCDAFGCNDNAIAIHDNNNKSDFAFRKNGGIDSNTIIYKKFNKSNHEKRKRLRERLNNGVIRVSDFSPDTITEMREFKELGLSYEKIAKLYGLSRYLICSALNGKKTKRICEQK
jgi:hypothetical protein